jgi:uncharacterized membrane protein YphA (DoxX/SURF4 family)
VLSIDPVVSWIAALAMALLFAAAVLHKLRDWPRFCGIVADYRIVPQRLATPAATAVVVLEIAVVTLLLWPELRPVGGVAAGFLLIVYAIGIAINLHRGHTTLDCGCVGAGRRSRIHRGMVVRNLLLSASMLLLVAPPGARVMTPLDSLTVAGVTIVVALLYAAIDTLSSVSTLRAEVP